MNPKVLPNDDGIRPAGSPIRCFYCNSMVGERHGDKCVIIKKKVKIKATVTLEVEVPKYWEERDIDFRYNEGTWCADNLIDMLEEEKGDSCLCPKVLVEYVETTDEGPLSTEKKD